MRKIQRRNQFTLLLCAIALCGVCGTVLAAPANSPNVVTLNQLKAMQTNTDEFDSDDSVDEALDAAQSRRVHMAPSKKVAGVATSQGSVASGGLWNLKDVDIRTLINEVALITRKDFIVAPDVDAKVTFIAKQALSPGELYQAFLAILRTYGYVAIPEGQVVKIVSDRTPDRLSGPMALGNKSQYGSEMVVSAIRVKNYPVAELIKVIRPLMPKYSFIDSYRPSNALIIADHADNLVKIQELVARLDTPAQDKVEVIRLQRASASDLVVSLAKLFVVASNAANARVGLQLSADDHTNSILVYGGTSDQRLEVRAAVAKLDMNYSSSRDNMEVFYLRYIPAETVAPVLQGIIENYMQNLPKQEQQERSGTTNTAGGGQSYAPQPRSTTGQFNLLNPQANYSSGDSSSSGSTLGSSIQSGKTFNAPRSGSLGSNIQWEESTNALIVTGPRELIKKCRKVVAKLDIRLPQVLIEVVIAEVDLSIERDLGIEWGFKGNYQAFTRYGNPAGQSDLSPATSTFPGASALGTLGTGLTLGVLSNSDLRAVLRALHTDSRSNILATPNLVTLDNQEATIKVGQKVSFATSNIANNATGGAPLTTYERSDVGLILVLKPQITPDGEVKLLIQQELSNVLPNTGGAGGNPDTSQRFITTTVMAKNGQTLVLGGLLQSQLDTTVSKVPLLGDIPLLGHLFRADTRTMKKTNLMIFMRPVVMTDDHNVETVTGGKYEFMRQQQMETDAPRITRMVAPTMPLQKDIHLQTLTGGDGFGRHQEYQGRRDVGMRRREYHEDRDGKVAASNGQKIRSGKVAANRDQDLRNGRVTASKNQGIRAKSGAGSVRVTSRKATDDGALPDPFSS